MRQIDFLKKSAELEKLSHAYIFFGNDSGEKKQTLEKFLEFLQCDPADIHIVAPENEITIAKIRELSLKLSLAPWASAFKIAVIEDAEKMNFEAQSAFLKLVEEPKGDAILFLLTQYPFLLLPTIRSRTQQIAFWKFENEEAEIPEEFKKLQSQNLEERFDFAKKLTDLNSTQDPKEVLEEWLQSLRTSMLKNLKTDPSKTHSEAKTIALVQEIIHLLKTTNVNPRLAVEQVLLEI